MLLFFLLLLVLGCQEPLIKPLPSDLDAQSSAAKEDLGDPADGGNPEFDIQPNGDQAGENGTQPISSYLDHLAAVMNFPEASQP